MLIDAQRRIVEWWCDVYNDEEILILWEIKSSSHSHVITDVHVPQSTKMHVWEGRIFYLCRGGLLRYLLDTTEGGGNFLCPGRSPGRLLFLANSHRILTPHTILPSMSRAASSASRASSNSMKANPGGLRATQTLLSVPYRSNSFSRSVFEPLVPKSPIYSLPLAIIAPERWTALLIISIKILFTTPKFYK